MISWGTHICVSLNSDPTGCFYTGNIVTGTVTLNLNKKIKVKTIDLVIVGISEAQWTRSMPTVPYIKIHSEKKKILYVKYTNIFENYVHNNEIHEGMYSYPFHFALPEDLPSTFSSSVAKTQYLIKIRSNPTYAVRKIVPFTVLSTVNVNSNDDMLSSCTYEFTKVLKRIAGKVVLNVKTYKSVALRQTIPFEITINNEEMISISSLHITLVQKQRYSVSSGYAIDEKKILKATHKIRGKSPIEFCNLSMDVPQITPSSIQTTDPMVEVSYVFRLELRFPFHIDLSEDIPVIITTIPVIFNDF